MLHGAACQAVVGGEIEGYLLLQLVFCQVCRLRCERCPFKAHAFSHLFQQGGIGTEAYVAHRQIVGTHLVYRLVFGHVHVYSQGEIANGWNVEAVAFNKLPCHVLAQSRQRGFHVAFCQRTAGLDVAFQLFGSHGRLVEYLCKMAVLSCALRVLD